MGAVFYDLSPEELCDLMCGKPEEDDDMSYIPDCRTDKDYNENRLNEQDKEFVAGYDYAVGEILNMFDNIDVYPDLEELLDDKKAIITDGKIDTAKESVKHWAEMGRNELITSIIDGYSEDDE